MVYVHDIRHLCWRFRIDGINIMSRGISGDEQEIKWANMTNRVRECIISSVLR